MSSPVRALLIAGLTFFATLTANASNDRSNCEAQLLNEFQREPNDEFKGLVTARVKMNPESMLTAYRLGIFPWDSLESGEALWHSPPQRGVLYFDKIHISTKDRKFIRKSLKDPAYEVTFDQAFSDVIRECAEMVRWKVNSLSGVKTRDGQWISEQFIHNYTELHKRGHAHSVEVWHNGILVAGLYGTFVDGIFSGESMFHKEPDAAKLALYQLIERLKENGHTYMDTQLSIGLLQKWGAEMVPRGQFQALLQFAHARNLSY